MPKPQPQYVSVNAICGSVSLIAKPHGKLAYASSCKHGHQVGLGLQHAVAGEVGHSNHQLRRVVQPECVDLQSISKRLSKGRVRVSVSETSTSIRMGYPPCRRQQKASTGCAPSCSLHSHNLLAASLTCPCLVLLTSGNSLRPIASKTATFWIVCHSVNGRPFTSPTCTDASPRMSNTSCTCASHMQAWAKRAIKEHGLL